jgi:hypothetical protein
MEDTVGPEARSGAEVKLPFGMMVMVFAHEGVVTDSEEVS